MFETWLSILRKRVNELTDRSSEQDRSKQCQNLRIKGMKEKMDEDTRQDVILLVREIVQFLSLMTCHTRDLRDQERRKAVFLLCKGQKAHFIFSTRDTTM